MPELPPRFIEGANSLEFEPKTTEALGILIDHSTRIYDSLRDKSVSTQTAEYFDAVKKLARYYGQVIMLFRPYEQEYEQILVDIVNERLKILTPELCRHFSVNSAKNVFVPKREKRYDSGNLHWQPETVWRWLTDMLSNSTLPRNVVPFANLMGGFGDMVLLEAVAERLGKPFDLAGRLYRMSSQKRRDHYAHIYPFEHQDLDRKNPILIVENLVAGGPSLPASVALFHELGFKQQYVIASRGVSGALKIGENLQDLGFKDDFNGLETIWVPKGQNRDTGPSLMFIKNPTVLLETHRRNRL